MPVTASFKYADRLDFQAAENSRTLLATARPQLSAPAPARPRTLARTLTLFTFLQEPGSSGESRSQRYICRVTIAWSTSEPSTQINYWTEILGYCSGLWADQSVRQSLYLTSGRLETIISLLLSRSALLRLLFTIVFPYNYVS